MSLDSPAIMRHLGEWYLRPDRDGNPMDGDTVISSIGTYLPPWGTARLREAGLDEDAVTMAVAAGRATLDSAQRSSVRQVVIVSRDLPLIEGGNSAALLAGLGLSDTVLVREQTGGGSAALDAILSADTATLVIGSDLAPAGAASVLCGDAGLAATSGGRISRSMPVVTRDAFGTTHDYSDPRLLRELGLGASLERLGATGKFAAVTGVTPKDAAGLGRAEAPVVPTMGASAPLFALAAMAERGEGGRLLAVDQATVSIAEIAGGAISVRRDEREAQPQPKGRKASGGDINISLAAYERAFDAKLRMEAAKCRTCGTLSYPHRYRCLSCGSEAAVDVVALPRDATIYTMSTIHVPVPGLTSPYSLVLVELGESGVRLLVKLTGRAPGEVAIGDHGSMVFRLAAMRAGVPDYGYAFLPDVRAEVMA